MPPCTTVTTPLNGVQFRGEKHEVSITNVMQVFQLGINKIYYNIYLNRTNNIVEKQIYFYDNCKVKISFSSSYLFQDADVLKHF